MAVAEILCPSKLFRLGVRPDPVSWPPRRSLDLPARDRFDDPDRKVRTLYASESAYGCILEIVARFRPAPGVLQRIDEYGEGEWPATGIIPTSEFRRRVLGSFSASPRAGDRFLDLREAKTLTALRNALAHGALATGIDPYELERSDAISRNRRLTHEIARWAIAEGYRGLAYESRWAHDVTNWAFFEPLRLVQGSVRALDARTDPDVAQALDALGVKLG